MCAWSLTSGQHCFDMDDLRDWDIWRIKNKFNTFKTKTWIFLLSNPPTHPNPACISAIIIRNTALDYHLWIEVGKYSSLVVKQKLVVSPIYFIRPIIFYLSLKKLTHSCFVNLAYVTGAVEDSNSILYDNDICDVVAIISFLISLLQ